MSDALPGQLEKILQGDEQAMAELWRLYFPHLARLAEQRMARLGVGRRYEDGDDVAASVLMSFFGAVRENRLDQLRDEAGLLRLLFQMTVRKVIDRKRKATSQKAGGGFVRGDSAFIPESAGLDDLLGPQPTPEFLASMQEECDLLFRRLEDEDLQVIAKKRFEGYSNAEIAQSLGCSVATVERRLKMIRHRWEEKMTERPMSQ